MKKLSKEKRNHLILVVMLTVMVTVGLYAGGVKTQDRMRSQIRQKILSTDARLANVNRYIKAADEIETELETVTKQLASIEEGMASGDLFAWFLRTINQFKIAYRVETPQLSQPAVSDVTLMPRFPYKQAAFTVVGAAHYEEFGRFLADFENQFPYARVQNLELSPEAAERSAGSEKLSFRMEIVILIKPNA